MGDLMFYTNRERKRTAVKQNPLLNQVSLGELGSHLLSRPLSGKAMVLLYNWK